MSVLVRLIARRSISVLVILCLGLGVGTLAAGRGDAQPEVSTPKACVGAEFATLGAIYESVFDSFVPSLPASVQRNAPAMKEQALKDMASLKISSLAVSNHPAGMGASPDSPMNTYREPLSQWIVTQLMNVRDGKAGLPISASNLTLSQAVETSWLYLYLTVIMPLTFVKDTLPGFYSLGPISVGTLITLPISLGVAGTKAIVGAISDAIVGTCIVRMSEDEQNAAGQPDMDLNFSPQVPRLIEETASQVTIAEPETCPAIGELPLSRIVERTSTYLGSITADPGAREQLKVAFDQLSAFMRTTYVPENLIPEDPADFTTLETLFSTALGLVPYVGGAVTDALIGLKKRIIDRGENPGKMVPLADLSVTRSMTAAYYAYAITTQVISAINDIAASLLSASLSGVDLLPSVSGIINAPNTYGLVVYHNVLRSLCLAEDRTVPTA